jgi:hypothetical protein
VQDLFETDLTGATVITMYLLPDVNLKLRPKLLALKPGTRIVSHDWDMGEWQPDRTVTLDVPDKAVGREKLSRVHLWVVPAQVAGTWCSVGKSRAMALRVKQTFQHFDAVLNGRVVVPPFDGRIAGPGLHAAASGADELQLAAIGRHLRVTRARGVFASLAGRVFERSDDASCVDTR